MPIFVLGIDIFQGATAPVSTFNVSLSVRLHFRGTNIMDIEHTLPSCLLRSIIVIFTS